MQTWQLAWHSARYGPTGCAARTPSLFSHKECRGVGKAVSNSDIKNEKSSLVQFMPGCLAYAV